MQRRELVMRNLLAGILGVCVLTAGVSCKKESAPTAAKPPVAKAAPTGEPIKIGAILAVTGPASFLGAPEAKTIKMLAEQINASGGVLGRKIELVYEKF